MDDPVHQRRLSAIQQALAGASRQEIADALDRSINWVSDTVRIYNRDGPLALADRRHQNPGRPFLLDEEGFRLLAIAIAQPHPDGGRWTGPKVNRWVEAHTGKMPHKNRGAVYLRRLGYRKLSTTQCKTAPPPTPTPNKPPFQSCREAAEAEKASKEQEEHLYPSDLNNKQWACLDPLLDAPAHATANRRAIVNALLYVLRTGCPWSYLPREYPPVGTVTTWFYRWAQSGVWKRCVESLREEYRLAQGRTRRPTVGIIDSQSTKTTEKGGLGGMTQARRPRGGSDTS